jgi:hypothetical protein
MTERTQRESLLGLIETIAEQKKNYLKTIDVMADMELVAITKYLWELQDEPFDTGCSYTVEFKYFSHKNQWVQIIRFPDRAMIEYPVKSKYMNFSGATDIWDDGTVPERLFEIIFEKKLGDVSTVSSYRRNRDERLDKDAKYQEKYGKARTPPTLVGVVKTSASGDAVRTIGLPRDAGSEKVEDTEGVEGS